MRHPWNALTELLALPGPSPDETDRSSLASAAREAWTETASRLGLVRLGWRPVGPGADFDLAFPCERALVKAEARTGGRTVEPTLEAALDVGPQRGPDDEEETRVAVDAGTLVAAAPAGELPPRGTLVEIATLAAGLQTRNRMRERLQRADQLATQGRQAAAAAHDLRNELTRALLHAARDGEGDANEVVAALGAARELAQSALRSDGGLSDAARPEAVSLRGVLVEEARAASASARVPDDAAPRLRVRCPADLEVLAEPSALGRAIRNLITNALEAAARRRAIGERAGQEVGTVEVLVERTDDDGSGFDLRVVVRDDGDGIAPAAVARFLETGVLGGGAGVLGGGGGDAAAHGKPASTGLGTASLRLAVAALGAPFRIESQLDGGTTASLRLRSAPARPPVLIVDPDVRRARRRVVEIAATEGGPAWALARPRAAHVLVSPDLVRRVECARGLSDPSGRAALARVCERQRVPLVWTGGAVSARLVASA